MFRHVVLFRFRPDATGDQRRAVLDGLRSLPARIPEIREFHVGLDAGLRDGNPDLAVTAVFDDETGWRTYVEHPEHVAVVTGAITPAVAERASVQFMD